MQGTAVTGFTAREVERARRYRRPLYVALLADQVLTAGTLAALAFSTAGDRLYGALDGLPWWGLDLAFTAAVLAAVHAVGLPLAFWSGYVHEHAYDLSTEALRGWWADRAKSIALGVLLTALPLFALVAIARALPGAWPAVVAPGAAALVVLLGFVGPVVLEPVFNRFEPLADRELAEELRRLADRAGVPVRKVLVADASRRTHKLNAYVSGLGRTRRVVLYDTLLARAGPGEIALVTAHELAHRRERHVVKATAIAAAGAASAVLVIWAVLSAQSVLAAIGADGAGDARTVPFVLMVVSGLELLGAPLVSALSRRWERVADRLSLELTQDPDAYERVHRELACANLADLDPPRLVYYLVFSHPTPPERLAAVRRG